MRGARLRECLGLAKVCKTGCLHAQNHVKNPNYGKICTVPICLWVEIFNLLPIPGHCETLEDPGRAQGCLQSNQVVQVK